MRNGWWLIVFGLFFLLTTAATPVWANAPPQGHGGGNNGLKALETPPHAEEQSPFGWALDLALWTLVVFLILVFVLGKFAWKPMIEGLDRRERTIHDALAEAHKMRDEAHRLRDQFQQEMARAQDKVRDMLEEARRNAQHAHDDMLDKARGEIKMERERLHREVELARDQALQDIYAQGARLATLVASKAIRRQLNPDDQRQLVDEALSELRQTNGQRV